MKKLFIYLKTDNKKILLRVIIVRPSFIGIGKLGIINRDEFRELAENLEPTSNRFSIVDV